MMAIKVFLKKEIMEIIKTNKIYIIFLLFLFFGLSSPILTKMMPEIISQIAGDFQILLPEQTWIDSFNQFFKNLNQIVLIAVIIVFMGSVVGEVERGTALLVLSKSSSRASFIIAKFLAAVVILIISLLIAYAGCLLYTIILFPDVSFSLSLQATLLFLIFSIYILSVTIGISAIVKSQIVAGVVTLGIYFISSMLSLFNNRLGYYSPGRLLKYQGEILNGTASLSDVFLTSAITIIISLAFLFLGIAIFNKREFYSNN